MVHSLLAGGTLRVLALLAAVLAAGGASSPPQAPRPSPIAGLWATDGTGGADPYGIAIARRLTAAPYTAYAKQARNDPADPSKWTAEQPTVVRPSDRPGFLGPVVELIGVQSVSAAETFTQALLNRAPKVVRVGEATQGVFSDVLQRNLPNGWIFVLANERFVTDGKSFDGTGIQPDVAIESFTPAARATGKDAAVLKALEIVKGGQQ